MSETPELEPENDGPLEEIDTDSATDDDVDVVDLAPPDLKSARFGIFGQFWNYRRQRKKRRKLLSKGYVQWFLIDDSYPRARFVKPKRKGGGIPELKHKGDRYLFPRRAMVPSKQQGMWTVVHKAGEADPINLRDPSASSIPVDELEEYLQLRVSSSPPSLLDQFDFEADELLKYGVIAVIGLAVMQQVLAGGLV